MEPNEYTLSTGIFATEITQTTQFDTAHPSNIAIDSAGNQYFTLHSDGKVSICRVDTLGNKSTYPNIEGAMELDEQWRSTIDIVTMRIREDVLYILDRGTEQNSAWLIAWDIATDTLLSSHSVPCSTMSGRASLLDFDIDSKHSTAYIVDLGDTSPNHQPRPAIIALNLRTALSRRWLESDITLIPERGTTSEGITFLRLDTEQDWLYYCSADGENIFRIATSRLADFNNSGEFIAASIEIYCQKPPCTEISADNKGNIYIISSDDERIGITSTDGYRSLIEDERLTHTLEVCYCDNYLYLIAQAMEGKKMVYHIYKLKSL